MKSKKSLADNKILGLILLIVGIFAALVIIHRTCCYFYEYDPEFAPYDYGRFNFFSFFTIQSNILVAFYLIIKGVSAFGAYNCRKLANNPVFGSMVTTYIVVTGAVFCAGIPLGFTPPFTWDTPVHAMTSFIQIFHHMIVPSVMIALWCFPFENRKLSHRYIPFVGIYPLVYSLFSIVRGALSNPHFFAYPFYNPEFDFGLLFRNKTYSSLLGYLSMIPLLIVGISLFIIIERIVVLIYEKRTGGNS